MLIFYLIFDFFLIIILNKDYFSIYLHRISNFLLDMANLNRIKVVLVEKQKTGKWLAEQLGKSNCTVSKWCSNTVQPDLKTLNEIANLLHIDVKDLLVSNNISNI